MEDRCIMCGDIIPEGRQLCPICSGELDIDRHRNISVSRRVDHHLVYNQQTPEEQVGD